MAQLNTSNTHVPDESTVIITNGNLLSMLSLGPWLAEYGHLVKAIFITTKLPSTKSNLRGIYDMWQRSGSAYTYFKLNTNRFLPARFRVRGLPTTIPDLIEMYQLRADIYYVENINEARNIERARGYAPRILLSFSATSRFCDDLLDIPSRVAINIHYALLPAYAGLSPYYWYVHREEPVSGITMHVMHSQLDAGPIICQEKFETLGIRSVTQLLIKQMQLVSPMLCRFYRAELHEDNGVQQDLSKRSYFRHPKRKRVREFKQKGFRFTTREDIRRLRAMTTDLRNQRHEVVHRLKHRKPAFPRLDAQTIEDSEASERAWYIAKPDPPKTGWLVYTHSFVLATLQGCVAEPHRVRRTPLWSLLGRIVQGGMACAQAVIMLFSWIPICSSILETVARTFTRNAVGFFIRSCYWKARLKRLGCDTIIDQGVDIWGPANVAIGSHCHIDTSVRLAAGERRHGQHGSITIGNNVHIGPGVHLAGRGGIEIRDFVGIMANAHLYSASGVIEMPSDPGQLTSMSHVAPGDRQHIFEAPILVDSYAFVGMMTRIMPGVSIGYGAVVHANSELSQDVPPFANIGGVPHGRQIGWRKPRRPSPHLPPPEQEDGKDEPVDLQEPNSG